MSKVQIGATIYPRLADVEERAKAVLRCYGIGVPIPDDDGAFIHELTKRHPDYEELGGADIAYFIISDTHTGWPNRPRAFVPVLKDGTRGRVFSYKTCLRGGHMPPRSRMLAAMRALVASDVRVGRDNYFTACVDADGTVPCQLTGVRVPMAEIEAHHHPVTFVALVDEFLAARGIAEATEVMTRGADVGWELADPALASSLVDLSSSTRAIPLREY